MLKKNAHIFQQKKLWGHLVHFMCRYVCDIISPSKEGNTAHNNGCRADLGPLSAMYTVIRKAWMAINPPSSQWNPAIADNQLSPLLVVTTFLLLFSGLPDGVMLTASRTCLS